MIFVDSNVPMYLIGKDRAREFAARRALEPLVGERRRLVTSSEVFQEILHRYANPEQRERIEPAFDSLQEIVDEVFAVDEADVSAAKDLLMRRATSLSSRDALHVAVMRHHAITQILSFDRGFDAVSGIRRLPDDPSTGAS